jgi:hypothetical protein
MGVAGYVSRRHSRCCIPLGGYESHNQAVGAAAKSRTEVAMSRYPMLKVMRAYHAPMTREEYLNTVYAGRPPLDENGDLDPELEAELPEQFRRRETVTHEQEAAAEENTKALVDGFIATLEHDLEEQ